MQAFWYLLIIAVGFILYKITPLARECSRFLLGRSALARCKPEDVPAVLAALKFDEDSRQR
jgi:hypothetical protein